MADARPVMRRQPPQISQVSSISSAMLDVMVALLPALGMAVYLFGPRVLAHCRREIHYDPDLVMTLYTASSTRLDELFAFGGTE